MAEVTVKDAITALTRELVATAPNMYPAKKTSYLFSNVKDIAEWLTPVPEESRAALYEKWTAKKNAAANRVRNSVRLSNLPMDVTDAELLLICGTIGVPRDIYRPRDYYTKEPKQYAFIDYEDPIDMMTAIKQLNGCVLRGMTICAGIADTAFTANPSAAKKRKYVSAGTIGAAGSGAAVW
jgi:RNA recognition motif-containing protein